MKCNSPNAHSIRICRANASHNALPFVLVCHWSRGSPTAYSVATAEDFDTASAAVARSGTVVAGWSAMVVPRARILAAVLLMLLSQCVWCWWGVLWVARSERYALETRYIMIPNRFASQRRRIVRELLYTCIAYKWMCVSAVEMELGFRIASIYDMVGVCVTQGVNARRQCVRRASFEVLSKYEYMLAILL